MSDCEELRLLFEADQADRSGPAFDDDPMGQVQRDAARRARVGELLDAGSVVTGPDHFHAAMVFQHGGSLASSRRAHELAARARELGDGRGTWLAAAALDRWLTIRGRDQHYGTQYQEVGGRWVLMPVDPATTDEERAAWNVPPLAEALARAERMTKERPPDARVGWTGPLVSVVVDREQVERGDVVEVMVEGRSSPVMVPLAGLGDLGDTLVMCILHGEAADGSDLAVRVVTLDDAPDTDFRAWAAPWASSASRTVDD